MQDLIADFFLHNINLEGRLTQFLRSSPEYRRAGQRMCELEQAIADRAPGELKDLLLEYEETINALGSMHSTGCYLFGLGLRQELRETLWKELL